MDDLRNGCLDTQATAIPIGAYVVREVIGVARDAQIVICLSEAPSACDQFPFVVPLQSGARYDVKDSIGAITLVRLIAASLHLEVIDIFWINSRSQIACNVGVRYF